MQWRSRTFHLSKSTSSQRLIRQTRPDFSQDSEYDNLTCSGIPRLTNLFNNIQRIVVCDINSSNALVKSMNKSLIIFCELSEGRTQPK